MAKICDEVSGDSRGETEDRRGGPKEYFAPQVGDVGGGEYSYGVSGGRGTGRRNSIVHNYSNNIDDNLYARLGRTFIS